jgi:hypothetical protein
MWSLRVILTYVPYEETLADGARLRHGTDKARVGAVLPSSLNAHGSFDQTSGSGNEAVVPKNSSEP